MPGKLRRFLHLERPRGADADGAARSAHGDRFAGLEDAPASPPAGGTGAAAGRFGPDHEPGLELALDVEGARPFQRCMACGRDHGRHEVACACGARLDTPEQHDWNERLWEERRAAEARLAAEVAEARARAVREEEELSRLRREMGIELARQVGDRERARLGMAGGGGSALGVRLLALVPERWRVHAVAGTGAAWLALLLVGLARKSPGTLFVAALAAILLLVPPGRGRGRWGGGWRF